MNKRDLHHDVNHALLEYDTTKLRQSCNTRSLSYKIIRLDSITEKLSYSQLAAKRKMRLRADLVVHGFGVDFGRPTHEANEPQLQGFKVWGLTVRVCGF